LPQPSAAPWFALLLLVMVGAAYADHVAEPPVRFGITLAPVADADTSGAEPLMQEALATARAELNTLLAEPAPEREALAGAYGRLGALLILVEVEAQADAALRNAMALQPDEVRWPYYAGYLGMLAGNLEQAVGYLQRARDIAPDYAPLYLRLGKVHLDRSALAEARQALRQAAQESSLAAPAEYYLGQIAVLERRFAEAIPLLEASLDANPEATEVHYPLAQAHRALGDEQAARRHMAAFRLRSPEIADPLIAELQAVTDRALPAFKEALHAVRGGDYATAVRRFAEGLEVAPDNVAARTSYARALWLSGDEEGAEAQLSRVLEQAPNEPLAVFFAGVIHEHHGDTEQAAARYRQVLAQRPSHAGALFRLASLDFYAKRYAEAAEGYRKALAADDGVAPARLLALVAARHAGEPDAALIGRLREQAAVRTTDPQLRYALARLLAAADAPPLRDAVAARELAVELNADPAAGGPIPPHRRALALARAAGGDLEGALELLEPLQQAVWMLPPAEADLLQAERSAYAEGRLPPAWPEGDLLLAPPPFSAFQVMRDYPAIKPY
jgi:tetratricopeptide (TPR) repeat protein